MDAEYWQQKWDEEKIGFHQADTNKRLVTFWPQVSFAERSRAKPSGAVQESCVFVPLCGKSLDMLWLHKQGHQVLGIELSDKAVQAFFSENHLGYDTRQDGQFTYYVGNGDALGITIMVGDYFALTPDHCQPCDAFYDRASMIAMPPDMRERYTDHLATLMPAGSEGLLLTISYDQSRMQGPPFSVTSESVQKLLGNTFNIKRLAFFCGPERLGNLRDRGLETLEERVYLLKRKVVT